MLVKLGCHGKIPTSDKRNKFVIAETANSLAAISDKGLFKITAETQNRILLSEAANVEQVVVHVTPWA